MTSARDRAATALARRADSGQPLRLWWRDDDAVAPSPALETLLALTETERLPLTLAVIPEPTGPELAARLDLAPHVRVALHGWSHQNHAPPEAKRQELAPQRPVNQMRDELRRGLAKLAKLHGPRLLPMLVPPWNRIAPTLVPHLAQDGFRALSLFGEERRVPALRVVNTHLDVMDWRGTGGGREHDLLWNELAGLALSGRDSAGLLTHHLVHDARVWDFLHDLVRLTRQKGYLWQPCLQIAGLAE